MIPDSTVGGVKTPCFILQEQELKRSIAGFRTALQHRFRHAILSYSVKTNSLPYVLKMACNMGCYAEVVSSHEYQLARKCGFPRDCIVYNGPMKSKETFMEAVEGGAIVNIECKRELEWLKELNTNQLFHVGLRLNINISDVSPEDADGTDDNSRFGFSDKTDDFKDAIDFISSLPNVKLSALHIHRTAHSRSIRFYRNSIRYACQVIRKYNLSLDYLDVGGGYFGIFPHKPTYEQYVEGFYEVLREYGLANLRIVVEPGNALIASCISFISEVIDVKHVENGKWFVTTDGSRNDIDPFFKKSDYLKKIYSTDTGDVVGEQIIGGCTCLEYDRLFILEKSPLLSIGDRILYNNVGAYTMCLSPLFIRYFPYVYTIDENENLNLIREAWDEKEFLQKSVI